MVKKLQISLNDNIKNEFQLLGINTYLEDYQLASFINEYTSLNLSLLHDHLVLESFALFVCQLKEKKIILLQNHNPYKQIAIEKLKSFDFLIIFSKNNNEDVINLFQKKEIFYANKIDINYLKEKDVQIINQLFLLIN